MKELLSFLFCLVANIGVAQVQGCYSEHDFSGSTSFCFSAKKQYNSQSVSENGHSSRSSGRYEIKKDSIIFYATPIYIDKISQSDNIDITDPITQIGEPKTGIIFHTKIFVGRFHTEVQACMDKNKVRIGFYDKNKQLISEQSIKLSEWTGADNAIETYFESNKIPSFFKISGVQGSTYHPIDLETNTIRSVYMQLFANIPDEQLNYGAVIGKQPPYKAYFKKLSTTAIQIGNTIYRNGKPIK
jgi:hypothetical protein